MPSNSKSCHNCRRRRLRCDRSWPSCHKCAITGQDCLGYGQIFVWTQGIDAFGKLKTAPPHASASLSKMSSVSTPALSSVSPSTIASVSRRHSHEITNYIDVPTAAPAVATVPISRPGAIQELCPDAEMDSGMDVEVPAGAYPAASYAPHGQLLHSETQPGPQPQHEDPSSTPSPSRASGVPTPLDTRSQPLAAPPWSPPSSATMAALTDPLFQDLDRNSRYYLSHFADRVCQDLVARDAPGNNPFRQLIPLANKHPLLLEILVATSAMHWSNIFRPTIVPMTASDPDGYVALLRSRDLVSRGALVDALAAKQRAMGHLRGVLDTLDPAGSEVVLAAMHFFIRFDLIDMERREPPSWKTHLEGACSILELLTPNTVGDQSHRLLRDCVMADCFIYHILGSTLTSGALAAQIARYAFDLLPVMERVEVNGYLSCPPEILQVILEASQLSCDSPNTDLTLDAADEALRLLDQALDFDIPRWASRLQKLDLTDMESRIHVASAHRSAACLYILQALPLVRCVRAIESDFLVNDILSHLSLVSEDDPFYKATAWPTFIAGAETRDGEKRTWSLRRLLAIWETCPWGYIFTAVEMLKATWELQDARRNSGDETAVNWLQDLKRLGFDYLIV